MHLLGLLLASLLVSYARSQCDPGLLHKLKYQNSTVIVYMNQRIEDYLSRYDDLTFKDLPTRRIFIYKKTKQFTRKCQRCAWKFLSKYQKNHPEVEFMSSTITNTITIFNATYDVITCLLYACKHLIQDIAESVAVSLDTSSTDISVVRPYDSLIPWNIQSIGAPGAWQLNITGKGAVVGVISTGVNPYHDALRRQRRESRYWFDAVAEGPNPYDDNGIGTAAASIAVGGTELLHVGVAPDAQWIACKACGETDCLEHNLIRCANYMANPVDLTTGSDGDSAASPDVILWTTSGVGLNPTWLGDAAAVFNSMSTVQVVPAGSMPPVAACGSISPSTGISLVLTMGSIDINNVVDNSIRRGPVSGSSVIKPNVCAPGVGVLAADYENNSSYKVFSESTIAAAHAAGAAAILKSATQSDPETEAIISLIEGSADPITSIDSCGGIDGATVPNYIVGHGKINFTRALQLLLA